MGEVAFPHPLFDPHWACLRHQGLWFPVPQPLQFGESGPHQWLIQAARIHMAGTDGLGPGECGGCMQVNSSGESFVQDPARTCTRVYTESPLDLQVLLSVLQQGQECLGNRN